MFPVIATTESSCRARRSIVKRTRAPPLGWRGSIASRGCCAPAMRSAPTKKRANAAGRLVVMSPRYSVVMRPRQHPVGHRGRTDDGHRSTRFALGHGGSAGHRCLARLDQHASYDQRRRSDSTRQGDELLRFDDCVGARTRARAAFAATSSRSRSAISSACASGSAVRFASSMKR